MKILLIAEQCNPQLTSVPLVSWFYFLALRKISNVFLVTQIRNRENLLKMGLVEDRDFTVIDSEKVARPVWRVGNLLRGGKGKGWTTVMALSIISYYYFEKLLWKKYGASIVRGDFDIVHRLTPLSPTVPSLIVNKCRKARVPFVLGPMNGGLPWPKQFRDIQIKEREWLSSIRGLSRLMPFWRSTYRNATAVLSGSRNTWNQLAAVAGERHIYMPRNGVDVTQFNLTERPAINLPEKPLNLIFVGRLVPYKGVDIVIEAIEPMLNEGKVRFDIAGAGPQERELRSLVARIQSNGVQFLGNIPHNQLNKYFASADLMVFPSIREFGGAVVLEAMACGLPTLVMDYGGPGELASHESGILIQLESRQKIVANIRKAVEELSTDRSKLATMGIAARKRVETYFDWDVKAKQLETVYNWVLGNGDKPDFNFDNKM